MAINSMTGFGRGTAALEGRTRGIEVRSVNHRYLDIKVRVPRHLSALEPLARTVAARHCERGRVDIIFLGEGDEEGGTALEIDTARAIALRDAHHALASTLDIPIALDTAVVAAWPGVLRSVTRTQSQEALEAAFEPALQAAFEALVAMRTAEGASLAQDLLTRLDSIETVRLALNERAPEQSEAYRKRLEGRMRDLLEAAGAEPDAARILHEVAVFAERTDIAEEISRLGSHIEQARGLIEAGADPVGRRLDFICQEMGREANTVGSKVSDIKLSELAIDLKAELERLREQIQNVE